MCLCIRGSRVDARSIKWMSIPVCYRFPFRFSLTDNNLARLLRNCGRPRPYEPGPRHLISAPTEKWLMTSACFPSPCHSPPPPPHAIILFTGQEKRFGRRDAIRDTASAAATKAALMPENAGGAYSRGDRSCGISEVFSADEERMPGLPS